MTTHERSLLHGLRAGVGGRVIGPDDPAYDEARAVFVPNVDRRPAAIVRPLDADDVAAVVGLAREHELELAVRSGGHSSAGHGTSEGGIVLDLALLRTLVLDPETRVASVGTGLTAGDVTSLAGPHGLAVPFGDTGSVGVGGLTLGGGVGYLARRNGLTIDSLLSAEVVTADGRILRADDERHADLFWALRGGGGNFGVATRFRYRLHPLDLATGGLLVLPATPETIAELVAAADAAPDELTVIMNVLPAPPLPFVPAEDHGRLVVMAMVLFAGVGAAAEDALAPLRAAAPPIADLIRQLQYPEMFPSENAGPRPTAVMRTTFVDAIDREAAEDLVARMSASTAQMPMAQIRVLGGATARVGADETAFAHRARPIMLNIGAVYASPDERGIHLAWAVDVVESLGGDGAYANFLDDEGEERVRAAYPGRTWDRLAEVKRRYDPENLFRLNQNVTPGDGQVRAARG